MGCIAGEDIAPNLNQPPSVGMETDSFDANVIEEGVYKDIRCIGT
jgi:hypothetical protein